MKKLWIILLTSLATLPLASVASADQPITLSDAELDNVTAGNASVSAKLTGDAIVFGAFLIGNIGPIGSFAEIIAAIIPLSGVPTLKLTVSADTFH
jgi:hypothetical protein